MVRTAAVLLTVILAATLAATASGAVRIVKIRFDPPGSDTGSNKSLKREWVKIKNTGNKSRSLGNWRLRDRSGHVYRFAPGFRLRAGRSVKVHTGRGRDSARHRYWDADQYIWNNGGDRATLKNANKRTIDRCSYSGSGSSTTC